MKRYYYKICSYGIVVKDREDKEFSEYFGSLQKAAGRVEELNADSHDA